MRKALALVIALAFVFSFAAPALADMPKPVDKLVHGTIDVVTSPIVIYDHTKSEMDSADFIGFGLVKGLVMSPFHVLHKAGGGLIDIVTFPIE